MNTIDDNQDTKLGITDVHATLPTPAAGGVNDNAEVGGIEDTTALACHREFIDTITGTLVRRGRRGVQQLEDDIPQVQMLTIAAARRGPMPKNLGEWKALGGTIAARYARGERKKAKARQVYDAGLCEDPEEHGPLERAHARDPVDVKRYLAILKDLFDAGKMPEWGAEILWGAAEEVPQKEIAEETGLSESQVRHRLAQMRRVFARRLAQLGMLTVLVAVGVVVGGPLGGVAANDVGVERGDGGVEQAEAARAAVASASAVVKLVTREERAKVLREEAAVACEEGKWGECLAGLDEARGLDQRGDAEEGVQAARRRAEEGVEDEEMRMSAKPGGR